MRRHLCVSSSVWALQAAPFGSRSTVRKRPGGSLRGACYRIVVVVPPAATWSRRPSSPPSGGLRRFTSIPASPSPDICQSWRWCGRVHTTDAGTSELELDPDLHPAGHHGPEEDAPRVSSTIGIGWREACRGNDNGEAASAEAMRHEPVDHAIIDRPTLSL